MQQNVSKFAAKTVKIEICGDYYNPVSRVSSGINHGMELTSRFSPGNVVFIQMNPLNSRDE